MVVRFGCVDRDGGAGGGTGLTTGWGGRVGPERAVCVCSGLWVWLLLYYESTYRDKGKVHVSSAEMPCNARVYSAVQCLRACVRGV